MANLAEEIAEKGFSVLMTNGDSMFPLIKENNSRVIVEKPVFPLKKYDVAVYKRGNRYIMHRVVKVKNGRYYTCGDNRIRIDKNVTEADIVAVMRGVCTDGKYVWCDDEAYAKYAKMVCRQYPMRWIKQWMKNMTKK